MYARCPHCPSCNWIEPPPAGGFTEVVCGSCGGSGIARSPGRTATTPRRMHVEALALAERHAIDFASAYAVLLGLMPPERAEELRDLGVVSAPPESPPKSALPDLQEGAAPDLPGIDPGFHEAVSAGRLSVQEALGRGDRETLVERLMQRHNLPVDLACMVADKRLPLAEALRQAHRARSMKRPQAQAAAGRRGGVTGRQVALVVGVAALSLTALGFGAWSRQTRPAREPQPVVVNDAKTPEARRSEQAAPAVDAPAVAETAEEILVQVERDERGRVVRVEGADPRSVLESYCEATGFQRTAMEVTDTNPPVREAKLGIFVDPAAAPPRRAIRIQRDWRTQRWIAGTGDVPVPERPADLPAQVASVPRSTDQNQQ